MIVVTTESIASKRIIKHLGIVKGNTVRARHIGHDFIAFLRNIVGGEIIDYTKMIAESREQATDRMIEEAKRLGADAVVKVNFSTSYVMRHAAEILVFGTAVIIEE